MKTWHWLVVGLAAAGVIEAAREERLHPSERHLLNLLANIAGLFTA